MFKGVGVFEERALGQDPVQGEAGRKEPVEAVKGGQGSRINGTLNVAELIWS